MTDRLKIGTRKADVLITEPKIEIKRPASKGSYSRAASVNIQRPSKASLIPTDRNQAIERLSQSISLSNDQQTGRRINSEKRSNNTSILSSPGGKRKKVSFLLK
jgi:hypothetical protein